MHKLLTRLAEKWSGRERFFLKNTKQSLVPKFQGQVTIDTLYQKGFEIQHPQGKSQVSSQRPGDGDIVLRKSSGASGKPKVNQSSPLKLKYKDHPEAEDSGKMAEQEALGVYLPTQTMIALAESF